MIIRSPFRLSAFLAFQALISNAFAGVTLSLDPNGELIGAKGVTVAGATYDVAFVDGTCEEVFSGCDSPADFVFSSQASATAAK